MSSDSYVIITQKVIRLYVKQTTGTEIIPEIPLNTQDVSFARLHTQGSASFQKHFRQITVK
jgi:hypothetical protein